MFRTILDNSLQYRSKKEKDSTSYARIKEINILPGSGPLKDKTFYTVDGIRYQYSSKDGYSIHPELLVKSDSNGYIREEEIVNNVLEDSKILLSDFKGSLKKIVYISSGLVLSTLLLFMSLFLFFNMSNETRKNVFHTLATIFHIAFAGSVFLCLAAVILALLYYVSKLTSFSYSHTKFTDHTYQSLAFNELKKNSCVGQIRIDLDETRLETVKKLDNKKHYLIALQAMRVLNSYSIFVVLPLIVLLSTLSNFLTTAIGLTVGFVLFNAYYTPLSLKIEEKIYCKALTIIIKDDTMN